MQRLRPETLDKYVSLAKSILKEVARKRGYITYSDLMDKMGGPGLEYMAEVLEEVSASEAEEGQPLLTAIVVHKSDGLPGYGFWGIRTLPESIKNASSEAKLQFWKRECQNVWNYWEKH